jgi:hypothetical protein
MRNIFIQNLLQKGWKKRNGTKWDAQNPNDIERVTKIGWEGELSMQAKRGLGKNMVK